MDDPLVSPLDEPTHVNPALDSEITTSEQKQQLASDFQSYFEEIDSKEPPGEPLPEAPAVEEAKVESPEPKKRPVKSLREIPEIEEEHGSEEADPLDSLSVHPQASTKTRSDFGALKEAAKTFRRQNQVWEKTVAPVMQELGYELPDEPDERSQAVSKFVQDVKTWKNGVISPETQAELEDLRRVARSVGILRDAEFSREFVQPVQAAYHDVIDEMALYFDAPRQQIEKDFLTPLKTKFTPSQLPPEWWEQQADLMTKAPKAIRTKIDQKIANVLLLQEKHDAKAAEFANDPQSFATYQRKHMSEAAAQYEGNVRDEVAKAFKTDFADIADWQPKPLDGVHDPNRRASIERHNARFNSLEKDFQALMRDFTSGPRSAARRALEFLRMREKLADPKLKDAVGRVKQLEGEVKAKRKLTDIPQRGRAGGKTQQVSKKLPLSGRKSLDDSFREWVT
jgi:hypothetical protein